MRWSLYGLALLVISFTAFSQDSERGHFADFDECKTHFEELKQEEIIKLNKKKQMMGAGMPGFVYQRKKRNIMSEYDTNLESCKAIAKS